MVKSNSDDKEHDKTTRSGQQGNERVEGNEAEMNESIFGGELQIP